MMANLITPEITVGNLLTMGAFVFAAIAFVWRTSSTLTQIRDSMSAQLALLKQDVDNHRKETAENKTETAANRSHLSAKLDSLEHKTLAVYANQKVMAALLEYQKSGRVLVEQMAE